MSARNRNPVSLDDLNQMQLYLGEETIEDYQDGLITRRAMLKRLITICGGSTAAAALMAACGVPAAAPAAPTSAPAPIDTTAPTATTEPTAAPTSAPTSAPTAEATTAAAVTSPLPTAASAGGAAAKSPLSVPANDPDVQASDVTYQSDTEIKGYLARPKAEGTYPGVIVIHENRGLNDHIKDVARRLAKAGYIALAPDLVSRMGGTASMSSDQVAGALGQSKPEDLVKDLSAGVDFLLSQPGVKPDKAGVVGFCFGGAYTLRLAAANPKIAAAVSYYGPAPQPVDQMANTNAAILGQYGANDQRVNSSIPDMETALKDAGKTFEKYTYEGAGHAFNNDTGANYDEAAATQAWPRTLDWFAKYLQ